MLLRRTAWIALAILLLLLIFLLGRRAAGYVPAFAEWVESLGPRGPLVFILGFIVATVAFVPGSILTLTGGALFGIVRGTIYVFIGASIGAMCAFLVSRYLARAALARRFAHSARFRAIEIATHHAGFKIVLLLRMSPAVPFNALNYALGLTRVRFRDYALGCIGMLPVVLAWVYYGRLIGDVARVVSGKHTHGSGYWLLLIGGLIVTVIMTAFITRAARRALRAAVEEHGE